MRFVCVSRKPKAGAQALVVATMTISVYTAHTVRSNGAQQDVRIDPSPRYHHHGEAKGKQVVTTQNGARWDGGV